MRLATSAIALIGLLLTAGSLKAEPARIGIAAPLSGPSELLGRQMLEGARAAAGDVPLNIVADDCSGESGAAAARHFVAAGVPIVVGFLCTESLEAALPILKSADIPVITPAVRTESLTDQRDKTGWLFYRLAPRADGEANAVATRLTRLWRDDLFAIVDDGTIYGRDLAESFRAAAELAALKPVFVDTYRPQSENQVALVARLRKAGAAHVFVGGDRDDIAIMTRDAASLGATVDFAGGETLRSAAGSVRLGAGTIMVGLPEWSDVADPAILAELGNQHIIAEGYVLPTYTAVQIARAADLSAPVGTAAAQRLTGSFRTVLGDIAFDAKGDLAKDPYGLFKFDGSRFVPEDAP